MKKLVVLVLAALMLFSCMVFVSADSPKRVIITDGSTVSGWDNDSKPFDVSGIPEPYVNTEIDPDGYGVVAIDCVGLLHPNGGWGNPEGNGKEPSNGFKLAYRVAKDETVEGDTIDLTGMNYLIFDMYISNAAAIQDVSFWLELTSMGGPDKEENSGRATWTDYSGITLQDGWNHLEIPLEKLTSRTGGECNFAAWNFLRMYNAGAIDAGEEGLTFAFKNIYFCEVSMQAEQAKAAAQAIVDLFTPIADISTGDVTADNYETVKAQLAAALEALLAADVATQNAVNETLDASKIERNVTRAIEKYEEELNKPAEPDTPDTPTPEVPGDDPATETPDAPTTDAPATDAPTTDAPTTDAPATDGDDKTSDATEPEKKDDGVPLYLIIGGAVVLVAIVVVVIVVTKKKK